MGIMAAISGGVGGLCAVMGIVTITDVIPASYGLGDQYTWGFWFALAAILLLASIVFSVAGRQNID
jgi:hypothetical protein